MKFCHRCRREYPANRWCECSGANVFQSLIEAVSESLIQERNGGRPQKQ